MTDTLLRRAGVTVRQRRRPDRQIPSARLGAGATQSASASKNGDRGLEHGDGYDALSASWAQYRIGRGMVTGASLGSARRAVARTIAPGGAHELGAMVKHSPGAGVLGGPSSDIMGSLNYALPTPPRHDLYDVALDALPVAIVGVTMGLMLLLGHQHEQRQKAAQAAAPAATPSPVPSAR